MNRWESRQGYDIGGIDKRHWHEAWLDGAENGNKTKEINMK
jgi:hypothetical protein